MIEMLKNNSMSFLLKVDTQGIEEFARNYYKEQGKDFDKEFSEFMDNFK